MGQLVVVAAQATSSLLAGAGATLAQGVASGVAGAAASYAAGAAQNLIYGPVRREREGPRIDAFRLQTSTEGAPIPVVYGRVRLAGQVIWASNFLETVATDTVETGGKGTGRAVETTTTTYLYSVSLAIGLCEGEITRLGRVWADGRPVSLQDYNVRLHTGTEDQLPDPVIEAIEGEAPAYRGTAYIVFEDLPLAAFGNRIPQFTFEVERQLTNEAGGALENAARAVCLIPGSGEAAYATTPILVEEAEGVTRAENVHNNQGGTDFVASVRALAETLPACSKVSLIVSWFGTDLRAGACRVQPGVELTDKAVTPVDWSVGGLARAEAYRVSQLDGQPAYGGTPSDASVIEAIRHLKARGFEVCFYPFILMDIAPGNGLPDPYGRAEQGAYPWRGRITAGPDDGTSAAREAAGSLFGAASAEDFSVDGDAVSYGGPDEWSVRRMILHYAHLCVAAGGVSSFLIGSEMRGLTTTRDATGEFPAVDAFRSLAAEVRGVLGGGTAISYAADWSEYAAYRPGDGTGDVLFPLDALWADGNIDFIGIDNYMPLADWRGGEGHADREAGWNSPYNLDYLKANIHGGEGYDWYYASAEDRDAQRRTPIADTAHGEDWVFRVKDLWNWWSQPHHERPGGVRNTAPTGWQPRSKPIIFTEIGCAAVDKAANQPNVFYDPKSSESFLPYYSAGNRDDLIQRRFLEAHLSFWADPANNPVSPVYSGPMVDAGSIYLYTWDARPYPDFPARTDVWADADNWTFGHWLTGRVGRVPLNLLVEDIARRSGMPASALDSGALIGLVTGYLLDRPMSPRAALEPLAGLYQFDAVETGDRIRFVPRGGPVVARLSPGDLVEREDAAYTLTKADPSDLPASLSLSYVDEGQDYGLAVAGAHHPGSVSVRTVSLDVPAVLDEAEAAARARALMADALVMARGGAFTLPPSRLSLDPADVVLLDLPEGALGLRLTEILDGGPREAGAVATASAAYDIAWARASRRAAAEPAVPGRPVVALLDLPLLGPGDTPSLYGAAFARPWPGGIAVWREGAGGGVALETVLQRPARLGRLTGELAPGPVARWDFASRLTLSLPAGRLASADPLDVLGGTNRLAVQSVTGAFEIVGFANAVLQPDGTWHLTDLLRGLSGTEEEASLGAAENARVVILDAAAARFGVAMEDRGLAVTRRAGPRGQGPDGPNIVTRTQTVHGLGWRPLSPVHLAADRQGGDIRLSWIRRTRIGGDSWTGEDVPLSEEAEAYDIAILDGGTLRRTFIAAEPHAVWTQAMIAEDFPGGGVATIRVRQRSAIFGPGRAGQIEIAI